VVSPGICPVTALTMKVVPPVARARARARARDVVVETATTATSLDTWPETALRKAAATTAARLDIFSVTALRRVPAVPAVSLVISHENALMPRTGSLKETATSAESQDTGPGTAQPKAVRRQESATSVARPVTGLVSALMDLERAERVRVREVVDRSATTVARLATMPVNATTRHKRDDGQDIQATRL